jgi:hypothetical protein
MNNVAVLKFEGFGVGVGYFRVLTVFPHWYKNCEERQVWLLRFPRSDFVSAFFAVDFLAVLFDGATGLADVAVFSHEWWLGGFERHFDRMQQNVSVLLLIVGCLYEVRDDRPNHEVRLVQHPQQRNPPD